METGNKTSNKHLDLSEEAFEAFCVLRIAVRFAERELNDSQKDLGTGLYFAFSRYEDAREKLEEYVDSIIRPDGHKCK
jgi:hypothetical protein